MPKTSNVCTIINRITGDDYEGHSLSMLQKIADALDRRIEITLPPRQHYPQEESFLTHMNV